MPVGTSDGQYYESDLHQLFDIKPEQAQQQVIDEPPKRERDPSNNGISGYIDLGESSGIFQPYKEFLTRPDMKPHNEEVTRAFHKLLDLYKSGDPDATSAMKEYEKSNKYSYPNKEEINPDNHWSIYTEMHDQYLNYLSRHEDVHMDPELRKEIESWVGFDRSPMDNLNYNNNLRKKLLEKK